MCIVYQKKGDPVLFFKIHHEVNLMLMDILERKSVDRAFLGIKADGNALYGSDVVHG